MITRLHGVITQKTSFRTSAQYTAIFVSCIAYTMALKPKRKGNINLVTGAPVRPGVAPYTVTCNCRHANILQQSNRLLRLQSSRA
jgi:hypothetical protein